MLLQSNDDVRFYFDDELGVRYGQLFEFEDPPYDRNEGIGTFTIHCQDPFLYSEVKTCSGKIPDLNYDFYDVKIERIEVTIKANTSKLVIRNITRGLSIILNGNFKTGDQVVVTPDTIAVNNQNRMAWLDYVESNYHDFVVFSEDEITTTPSQYLTIKYRERVL